jgi:phosphopantetheine--protein transferase-like protein
MSEVLKQTISLFLQSPSEQIHEGTVIDRTALGSSVIVHRMYAKIAEAGFAVQDYHNIISYGDLLNKLNGGLPGAGITMPAQAPLSSNGSGTRVGIDIEHVSSMPKTNDFREDEFYAHNFSAAEISHCILQHDPYASFAGLFAAKEAIFKAGGFTASVPYSQVEIGHKENGQPFFGELALSISHTDQTAVAVAYKEAAGHLDQVFSSPSVVSGTGSLFKIISVLALMIGLISLGLIILK